MRLHDAELETSVLSTFLQVPGLFDIARDYLRSDSFHDDVNRQVFDACCGLVDRGRPLSLLTLRGELTSLGLTSEICGELETCQLLAQDGVIDASKDLKALEGLRGLKTISESILRRLKRGSGDPEKLAEEFQAKVYELTTCKAEETAANLSDCVTDALQAMRGGIVGYRTGFDGVDEMMGGLHPGELTIVAARPGVGKSALVLNVVSNLARAGYGCVLFSLEMPRKELGMRLLCSYAGANILAARTGAFTTEDWQRITAAQKELAGLSAVWIDDKPGITLAQVRSKLRKFRADCQRQGKTLGIVAIDYLQLMSASRSGIANREQEIAEITRNLKATAKEFDVPIVALSQLNRMIEHREGKMPQLSDLRESGAIEQDADNVLFITRKETQARLVVAKQRNGPVGTIELVYSPEYTKFVSACL